MPRVDTVLAPSTLADHAMCRLAGGVSVAAMRPELSPARIRNNHALLLYSIMLAPPCGMAPLEARLAPVGGAKKRSTERRSDAQGEYVSQNDRLMEHPGQDGNLGRFRAVLVSITRLFYL